MYRVTIPDSSYFPAVFDIFTIAAEVNTQLVMVMPKPINPPIGKLPIEESKHQLAALNVRCI